MPRYTKRKWLVCSLHHATGTAHEYCGNFFEPADAGTGRLAHLVQLPYSFCVKWPS
jgi:hypothetical protein